MKLFRNVIIVACVIGMMALTTEVIVRRRLNLVEVVVLKENLAPRSLIKESDLKVKKVSAHFVGDEHFKSMDEVIGYYVKHQHTLYKEQVLLSGSVEKIEDALDEAALLLQQGERVYALKRDVVGSLGGSLQKGSMVDIAVQDKKNKDYGTLVTNIRVIGIKDRNGNELNEGGIPHVILLALHEKDIHTVLKAESDGNLVLLAKGFVDES